MILDRYSKVQIRVGVAMDFGELTALIRPCPSDSSMSPITADVTVRAKPKGKPKRTRHFLRERHAGLLAYLFC